MRYNYLWRAALGSVAAITAWAGLTIPAAAAPISATTTGPNSPVMVATITNSTPNQIAANIHQNQSPASTDCQQPNTSGGQGGSQGTASAPTTTISTQGPNSGIRTHIISRRTTTVHNTNTVAAANTNHQHATTGSVTAVTNTTVGGAGSVSTGNATNANTTAITLNLHNDAGSTATSAATPESITETTEGPNSGILSDIHAQDTTTITNTNTADITNTNDQSATSGDTDVSNNTSVGDVTTGDASNTNDTGLDVSLMNTVMPSPSSEPTPGNWWLDQAVGTMPARCQPGQGAGTQPSAATPTAANTTSTAPASAPEMITTGPMGITSTSSSTNSQPSTGGRGAGAPAITISTTGPNSGIQTSFDSSATTNITNTNTASITNTSSQTVTSGSADVSNNTSVGSVSTGNATNTNHSTFDLTLTN